MSTAGLHESERDLEREKLALEGRKIDLMETLERDKLQVERYKARLQAVAIGIPLLGAVITLALTLIGNAVQARAQFRMKAAELIMKDNSPDQSLARARMLAKMFQDSLRDINLNLNPDEYADRTDYENISVKLKVLDLLVEHPGRRDQIIAEYARLFPGDRWVERLRIGAAPEAR